MIVNLAVIDTTPGAVSPMAPPHGWDGDRSAYLQLMRDRYDALSWSQEMLIAAKILGQPGPEPEIRGPWADVALEILERLREGPPKRQVQTA
jgi:hypothetical protein